ncbi:hypothetical protein COS81_04415 [candidate division WWE3 bacterium CG06_land_8_20_14_3_00_42_16]|uniref:Uncharacterized protein n=2 Tax=Katanobacteria TaxID=422282 RepID=A0A2M7ALM4_UNCKA|nr:MAG: hypothetical protein AUJ38_03580 [bacterium CG1_02_42_9]PIU68309.1 MAG: hypothetical protein COS81_04415 [candidate division WWE3 bacterium CG06_land_8_20_14_3_00_42_16]PJA37184.1 MAG: hypothetical protein CO181_04580 [candidate division WWE3 bacterium CG_4_9_14_3_um_filter_43_9]
MAGYILKLDNLSRSHSLKVYSEEVEINTHFPTQTLRDKIKIGEIEDVAIQMDPTQNDPRYCIVSIKGKGRLNYTIPELETYQARHLKSTIETQRSEFQRKAESGKSESKLASALKNFPVIRKRFG